MTDTGIKRLYDGLKKVKTPTFECVQGYVVNLKDGTIHRDSGPTVVAVRSSSSLAGLVPWFDKDDDSVDDSMDDAESSSSFVGDPGWVPINPEWYDVAIREEAVQKVLVAESYVTNLRAEMVEVKAKLSKAEQCYADFCAENAQNVQTVEDDVLDLRVKMVDIKAELCEAETILQKAKDHDRILNT
jgi:hypothetical protein